jgi:hypothetical protein
MAKKPAPKPLSKEEEWSNANIHPSQTVGRTKEQGKG